MNIFLLCKDANVSLHNVSLFSVFERTIKYSTFLKSKVNIYRAFSTSLRMICYSNHINVSSGLCQAKSLRIGLDRLLTWNIMVRLSPPLEQCAGYWWYVN